MSAFSEFFLMKPDDVKHYAAEVLHRFDPDEETTCTEIGDGNINYVFRVRSLRDGRSVIVRKPPSIPLLTNPLIPTTMTITTFRWIASKRC